MNEREMSKFAGIRWIILVCLSTSGLGSAMAQEKLAELAQDAEASSMSSPIPRTVEVLDPAIEQMLTAYLDETKQALKAGDLSTAASLIEQARALDPTSEAAHVLHQQLQQASRLAEEKARRTLIATYQREGLAILRDGDFDRALMYFQAAQALDPTNRKTFKLIQRADATQHHLVVKQQEQAFQERVRLSRAKENGQDIHAKASSVETASLPVFRPPSAAVPKALRRSAEALTPAEQDAGAVRAPSRGAYTIQPEDVLQFTVYGEPDLSTRSRVTSSGEIAFPLLGRVAVADLTVPQVKERLETLLAKDYLVNPQVQVFIESYHPRNVFVTGAVNKPGSYPIPVEKPTTLMETIAMAGGFSKVAAPNSTRIVRIENGQQRIIYVRANDIIQKGDKNQDVEVRSNDIIFIPESFF